VASSYQARINTYLRQVLLQRRAALLMSILRPDPNRQYSVLDVGGNYGDLVLMLKRAGLRGDFTIADIYATPPRPREGHPDVKFLTLSEGGRLPFEDCQFDLVISNAVIEHVTMPKAECTLGNMTTAEWRRRSGQRQGAFAAEIRRVARAYVVQTPHRDFPIDCHLWLPFTNWLPHNALVRLARVTDKFWIKHSGGVDWHLLGTKDMKQLFPDAELITEHWFGVPKALIAYRRAS
jgi:SAM-dependent methyltransferase